MLDTTHPNHCINKLKSSTKLRHNIDLYNDTQGEKFIRTVAERLEVGINRIKRNYQSESKRKQKPSLDQKTY